MDAHEGGQWAGRHGQQPKPGEARASGSASRAFKSLTSPGLASEMEMRSPVTYRVQAYRSQPEGWGHMSGLATLCEEAWHCSLVLEGNYSSLIG